MCDRHLAAHAVDHERLRIFDCARSGGGITGVANRAAPFQLFQFGLTENLRDQTHVFVDKKGCARAVARHDACALLSAMLEREQTVVGEHGCIWMTKYAEKPALVLRVSLALSRFWDVDGVWRGHTRSFTNWRAIQWRDLSLLECAGALALSVFRHGVGFTSGRAPPHSKIINSECARRMNRSRPHVGSRSTNRRKDPRSANGNISARPESEVHRRQLGQVAEMDRPD